MEMNCCLGGRQSTFKNVKHYGVPWKMFNNNEKCTLNHLLWSDLLTLQILLCLMVYLFCISHDRFIRNLIPCSQNQLHNKMWLLHDVFQKSLEHAF